MSRRQDDRHGRDEWDSWDEPEERGRRYDRRNHPDRYDDAGQYERAGRYGDAGQYERAGRYADADRYERAGRYADAGQYERAGRYADAGGYERAGRYADAGGYERAGRYGSADRYDGDAWDEPEVRGSRYAQGKRRGRNDRADSYDRTDGYDRIGRNDRADGYDRTERYDRPDQYGGNPRRRGYVHELESGWENDPWEEPAPKKKSGGFGTFLIVLLLVVAVGVFAYSGYRLLGYYMAYKAGDDEYKELNEDYLSRESEPQQSERSGALTDVSLLENPATLASMVEGAEHKTVTENNEEKSLPVLVNPVDFTELQAVNPEVIGWIRIGAINVSYPVAQAADNDFYLHRTFKKVDNFAGCIFENCENSPYFTDQNTIIYGHNMKNGSMFGRLGQFSQQATLDRNPYFWIFTPHAIFQYRIFSSSVVSKSGDPYAVRFREADFAEFINRSASTSEINCGNVSVTTSDRLVTLSTCTGDDSTRRIVQGVLVQIYAPK